MTAPVTPLLRSEWIKIRSIRSTVWSLMLTIALSSGLAYLFGSSFRAGFDEMSAERQAGFDPLFATFYSLTIGQLALVVLAVFVVTGEYSTGTIRTSLAAVPGRGVFFSGKVLAGALVAAAGACLYLILIYLFATGVATLLRGSISTLAVLLPLLFLGSQGLGNVPKVKTVAQFLPDQAGMVAMHIVGPAGDPQFARPYGPWAGLGIMSLWAAAALLAGYVALRRRDA